MQKKRVAFNKSQYFLERRIMNSLYFIEKKS